MFDLTTTKEKVMKRYHKGFAATCNVPSCFFKDRLYIKLLNIAFFATYIVSIPVSILPAYYFYIKGSYMVSFLSYMISTIFIARQIRGIENMVHDASHLTWIRKSKSWNNKVTTMLLGAPVLTDVSAYSKSHDIHHKSFASKKDPCLIRFNRMGVFTVNLSTKLNIIQSVLRWLPLYNLEYYKEIGSKSFLVTLRFLLWHMIVYIIPIAIIMDVKTSLILWVLYFIIPLVITLPCLRSIAEVEEHDYHRADTEFLTTYNNIGLFHHLIFHPFKDSYHLIHHMYPTISVHKHKKLHHFLLKNDKFYAENQLSRTKVLEKI